MCFNRYFTLQRIPKVFYCWPDSRAVLPPPSPGLWWLTKTKTPRAPESARCKWGWMYLYVRVWKGCKQEVVGLGAVPEQGGAIREVAGAARQWQEGCPGMVWWGCWLTLPPRQGVAMLICCHCEWQGTLSIPCASQVPFVTQVLCQVTSCPSPQGESVPPAPFLLSLLQLYKPYKEILLF